MPRILNERPSDAPALPSVDRRVFRLMLPFLWPRDDRGLRVRLAVSMTLLCLTAALNATVASKALPPASRIWRPTSLARGWAVATAPLSSGLAWTLQASNSRAANQPWSTLNRSLRRVGRRQRITPCR